MYYNPPPPLPHIPTPNLIIYISDYQCCFSALTPGIVGQQEKQKYRHIQSSVELFHYVAALAGRQIWVKSGTLDWLCKPGSVKLFRE